MFTAPKTTGSAAGVGLSARVVAEFKRQAERQAVERAEWADCYEDGDLVFARVNGAPLRPDWVLDRFHEPTEQAGLPRVRIHNLRHLAATLMKVSGVASAASFCKIPNRSLPATSPFRRDQGRLVEASSHTS